MGVSVGQLLRQAALRAPARVGLVDLGHEGAARRELTYAELDLRACRAAAGLRALGVKPGDRVALLADNSAELVSAWFGVVYAGAAVVPLPAMSAAPEVAYRLSHAGVNVLLHDDKRAALASAAAASTAHAVVCRDISSIGAADVSALEYPHDTGAEAVAMVLYTSGTTGKPKGAAISHASLALHTAALTHHALRLDERDTVLCMLPIAHSFGCRMGMLAPMFALARIVLVPRFGAARTHALLAAEAVTWVPVVPTMLAAWVEHASAEKPSALRWVLSAGAPLPDELARRAESLLGTEVRQGYGMTEATFSTIDAPPQPRTLGSVGRPTWGVELRIVDAAGRQVPRGEHGEVWARGQNVMTHYLFDPAATQLTAADGWVRSGDIGCLDADGKLRIVDRVKDLVIRGGFNVYPSEVEDALAAHAGVAQVAVIGRPDSYYGEEIVAVIVLKRDTSLTAAALDAWCRPRLSSVKLPRQYAFVERLPLGPSGKVQKRELRDALLAGELAVVTLERERER